MGLQLWELSKGYSHQSRGTSAPLYRGIIVPSQTPEAASFVYQMRDLGFWVARSGVFIQEIVDTSPL